MIDAMKQALEALENTLDCLHMADWDDTEVSAAITALRAAIEAAERAGPSYWQEEARRYAENADYWRGKYEAAIAHPPAITDEMVERAAAVLSPNLPTSALPPFRKHYLATARAALEAALGVKHAES